MLVDFQQLKENASIFIFPSNHSIKEHHQKINQSLSEFIEGWLSHQVPVEGSFKLVEDMFVVVGANPTTNVSGCSKDSLRHTMEQLGRELNIDFFNNSSVYYFQDKAVHSENFLKFKEMLNEGIFPAQQIVFDTLVATKEEFDHHFKKQIKNSVYSKWMKTG